MTFWSGETLEQRLPALIPGFDPAHIDCAAYTLHVGQEVYISPTSDAVEPKAKSKIKLQPDQSFTVPPGQFAFLLTREKVSVPKDAIAFISMKARKKFRGLVNVSGFHVDPGYNDRLIFAVFNAGPAPVHLQEGEACFLIWYANLDTKPGQATKYYRSTGGFGNIPTDLINPIAGEIQSFEGLLAKIKTVDKGLDDRLRVVEREQHLVKWIATAIVTAILTIIVYPIGRDAFGSVFFESNPKAVGTKSPVPTQPPTSTKP